MEEASDKRRVSDEDIVADRRYNQSTRQSERYSNNNMRDADKHSGSSNQSHEHHLAVGATSRREMEQVKMDKAERQRELREREMMAQRQSQNQMARQSQSQSQKAPPQGHVKSVATYADGHPKYKLDADGVKMGKYVFDEEKDRYAFKKYKTYGGNGYEG